MRAVGDGEGWMQGENGRKSYPSAHFEHDQSLEIILRVSEALLQRRHGRVIFLAQEAELPVRLRALHSKV